MSHTIKKGLIIFGLLALVVGAELLREVINYNMVTKNIMSAQQNIELGLTKEQVNQLMGNPTSVITRDNEEILYWETKVYQGYFFKLSGIYTQKGHYELGIKLNDQGQVIEKWDGVN